MYMYSILYVICCMHIYIITQHSFGINRIKIYIFYLYNSSLYEVYIICVFNLLNFFFVHTFIILSILFVMLPLYRCTGCLSTGHDTLGCFTPESWDRFQYCLTALKPSILTTFCTFRFVILSTFYTYYKSLVYVSLLNEDIVLVYA